MYRFVDIERPNGHTVIYGQPFTVANPDVYDWDGIIGDFEMGQRDAIIANLQIGESHVFSRGGTQSTRVTKLSTTLSEVA